MHDRKMYMDELDFFQYNTKTLLSLYEIYRFIVDI